MTTAVLNPTSSTAFGEFPLAKRWTVEEFHQICGEPTFRNNQFILIEGEILEMPVPNAPHDVGIGLVQQVLMTVFPSGYWVRSQLPLILSLSTDPMPDFAVVSGSPRDYIQVQPRTATLVVEVSDSTLKYDLGKKANVYAAGMIPEYWVVDLVHRKLHVMREPARDADQPFGACYNWKQAYDPAAEVSPLSAATTMIRVSNLLP